MKERSHIKKKFCESEGARKSKALEERENIFQWSINVRGVPKGRVPIKMFRSKSEKVYSDWLKQQPGPIHEEEQQTLDSGVDERTQY